MKSKVVLVGAGGKMGLRCVRNLLKSADYELGFVEVSPTAITRLTELNVAVSEAKTVLPGADMVILAVPDNAMRAVSAEVIPQLKAGAVVVILDPAAPLAGHLPNRPDLSYYVTHPSHPSVFNWEATEEAQRDFYGGKLARQTVVSALMQGPQAAYGMGDALTKVLFQPVTTNHRITVEQMAILEPGFSETLSSTCIKKIRDALDVVVEKGVPYDAARDFILGHIQIQLAVLFDELPIQFSDAAIKALDRAESILFKDDWKKIFEMDNIHEQIEAITSK